MKICFLCGSIAPGRDGVGDYTSAIAKELLELGHEAVVVSLMEQETTAVDHPFRSLRLQASQSWEEKATQLKEWLVTEKPDVLSLQYVPYTFEPRGMPFGFAKWLQQCGGSTPIHIMFHELWVAAEKGASIKNSIIGLIQERIIASMLKRLRPIEVHTSNRVYQELLRRIGWQADILPIFSNIVPAKTPKAPWDLYREKGLTLTPETRDQFLVAAIFGTVHPTWNPLPALILLDEAAAIAKKHPILLLVGRNGAYGEVLESIQIECYSEMGLAFTGPLEASELSGVLQSADIAFSAAPWALAEKSSAGMAHLAHGLPLIFTDDSWRLKRGKTPLPENLSGCYLLKEGLSRKMAEGLPRPEHVYTAKDAAKKLYQDIDTKIILK